MFKKSEFSNKNNEKNLKISSSYNIFQDIMKSFIVKVNNASKQVLFEYWFKQSFKKMEHDLNI